MTVYMLLVDPLLGPRATWPAGNVFWKTSKVLGLLSLLVRCTPASTQLESIHERRPRRVSTATETTACWLIVNVTRGLPAAALELLAVRIHCAPRSAVGMAVSV